jgi:hypothetical protein
MSKITLEHNEFLEVERRFHDNYAKKLDWDKPLGELLSYEESGIDFLEIEKYFNICSIFYAY